MGKEGRDFLQAGKGLSQYHKPGIAVDIPDYL